MPHLFARMLRNGRACYVLADGPEMENDLLRGTVYHAPEPAADPAWDHPQFCAAWCVLDDGSRFEFVQGVLLEDGGTLAVEDRPGISDTPLPEWARPVLAEVFRRTRDFAELEQFDRDWELPAGIVAKPFSTRTLKSV